MIVGLIGEAGAGMASPTMLIAIRSSANTRFSVACTCSRESLGNMRQLTLAVAACGSANYPRDPADRLIRATAIAEGCALLTAAQRTPQTNCLHTPCAHFHALRISDTHT